MSQGDLVYPRGLPRDRARRKETVVSQVAIWEVRNEVVGDTCNPSAADIDAHPLAKPIRQTNDVRPLDGRLAPAAIPWSPEKTEEPPGLSPQT